ncbi:hypothetical protein D9M71_831430 [compost metagenome]
MLQSTAAIKRVSPDPLLRAGRMVVRHAMMRKGILPAMQGLAELEQMRLRAVTRLGEHAVDLALGKYLGVVHRPSGR